MNKEKQFYEAPTAQTFVVKFEGMICVSNNAASNTEYFNYNPLTDDEDL